MVANQIRANRQAQDDWNMAIMESGHQAALARIELEAYKSSNIFGVESPYAKLIAGANEYATAMKELNDNSMALANGSIQIGTRQAISGGNIAKGIGGGAATGAAIGTIVPVIGTAIGAVIGAVIGGIFGAASKKTVPVFENLKKHYGEIYNKDTFELNPDILADYDKLDGATKKLVDNWGEVKTKAKEAQESMQASFKDLAGSIGSDLSDSLVAAFRNDDIYSAVDDFKKKVSSVIESIIAQLVFSVYFENMFKNLEKGFNDSFGLSTNGVAADPTKLDNNVVDDIVKFTNDYASAIPAYNEAMKAVQEAMKAQGFDLFNTTGTDAAKALSGSIKNISEDTAGLIAGQMNAIRMNQGAGMGIMRDSLFALTRIATNTDRLQAVENSLRSIDAKIAGGSINDLSGTGIKL